MSTLLAFFSAKHILAKSIFSLVNHLQYLIRHFVGDEVQRPNRDFRGLKQVPAKGGEVCGDSVSLWS